MAEYIQACGCRVSVETSVTGRYEWGRIVYCSRHDAAPVLCEAVRKAEQLPSIATDWNLSEVEIDGEMVSVYDLRREFVAGLTLAGVEKKHRSE